MNNSLQEIDNKIATFCTNHSAVNQYECGDFSTFNSKDYQYPLIYATPTRLRIVKGQVSYILNIVIMDNIYDKSDLVKVLSDLSLTISELMTYIDDDSDNFNYYETLNIDFQSFYRGIDNTCGWQGDIVFNMAYGASTDKIRWK